MDGMWHWVSCLEKRAESRSEEDLDIVLSKLKTMKVFENYPENVLEHFSRCALYESFMEDITLFKPGEEGVYWYAVISGGLEMLDVDPTDATKMTSICHLQDGDSFGENVIFETTRQTTVITRQYCELLCVESKDIREIYDAHKQTMERLLHLNSFEPDTQQGAPIILEPDGTVATEEFEEMSELALAGVTLHQIIQEHFTDLFCDCRVNLYTYRNCCSGRRLVDWVLAQSGVTRSRPQAAQMWQALLTEGILRHVHNEHGFKDDTQLLYQFVRQPRCSSCPPKHSHLSWTLPQNGDDYLLPTDRPLSISSVISSPRSSVRSSLTSILDECFDTITQLGPEVLIFATLNKDPSLRNDEDIDMIFEELMNVKAFRHLSNAVKRKIAACVKLVHFPKAGQYLFHQGDRGDSWYVILKGSVNVIITGKGVVCTLHEGDEFGKLALVNEGLRSASVQAREDNCCFLQIERDDFRRILLSVESMTMRFVEHGRDVLHLEKSNLGRYAVVKGTPEKMLDHLLESEISQRKDTFAADFFLTYPAFMTISELCGGLIKRYHSQPDKNGATAEAGQLRKKRVAEAVSTWIRTARAELVKDATFLKMLTQLQDLFTKDGLLEDLKSVNSSLSESIRSTTFNSPTPGGITIPHLKHRKATAGQEPHIKMGISTFPPSQPQDKVPLRIRCDMKTRDILEESCVKLSLDPSEYILCEVKSSGEKVVLKENSISVHSEISVNSRLFLVPINHTDKALCSCINGSMPNPRTFLKLVPTNNTSLKPPLPDQNAKPVTPFPEKEGSREMAAHLTVHDWNLFTNTQQMELIYCIFGRHKFGKITTNLDLFVRRFNEVQFWVVTELCREPDPFKRVNILKKFIKIAGYCKEFNNLNSFFAVVVGLMNGAVTRLRQTWKELPPKFKRRFESFESLTDPSRNHKVLRAYQSKLPPPVIPFMPLVMKDCYFLHEGNATLLNGMVNFEKMRLVASKVESLNQFRNGSLSSDIRLLANKNPQLQQYIRTLRVIDNQHKLTQMSHSIEPTSSIPLSS